MLFEQPGAVTISVTPTFAAKVLISRLAELNAALPGVELRTVATEALSDFDRDQVGFAVRFFSPPVPNWTGGKAVVSAGTDCGRQATPDR